MGRTTGAACDIGKARLTNEDAVLLRDLADGWLLAAVADGMGGLGSGDIASQATLRTLTSALLATPLNATKAPAQLTEAFDAAHEAVRAAEPDKRIGTTLVAALINGSQACIANVGDSRAYLLKDGLAAQLTADHSLAAERCRAGLMTPAEAADSKFRHVLLRAIGTDPEAPRVDTFGPIELADATLLLCSDGLYSMLSDAEIAATCQAQPPAGAANHLVRLANERGGRDNISVVIVSCQDAP